MIITRNRHRKRKESNNTHSLTLFTFLIFKHIKHMTIIINIYIYKNW